MAQKKKTADYTRRAIDKYDSKFDRVAVRLPAGYAALIRDKIGKSCNAYLLELARADLFARGLVDLAGDIVTDSGADGSAASGSDASGGEDLPFH